MNPIDVAWLAGLFEGEGSVGIYDGKARMTIRMTDRDVIERVHGFFPYNSIQVVNPKPVRAEYNQPKTQYAWRLSRREHITTVLELILPFLGERRSAKAREVLDYYAGRPLQQPGDYQRAKTHCIRGHEFTPENTYVRNYGRNYRRCRACAVELAAQRKIDKKSAD